MQPLTVITKVLEIEGVVRAKFGQGDANNIVLHKPKFTFVSFDDIDMIKRMIRNCSTFRFLFRISFRISLNHEKESNLKKTCIVLPKELSLSSHSTTYFS